MAREVPWAPEAEVSVLGGCLIDTEAIAKAAGVVTPEMFHAEKHRRIFDAVLRLDARGDVVDPVTLEEELKRTGDLAAVGGLGYLAELLDAVPTAANVEFHARLVRDAAVRRRLIEAGGQIAELGFDLEGHTPDGAVDAAQELLSAIALSDSGGGLVWVKKLLNETFTEIERRAASKDGITGLATGFPDLDHQTGGLQKGDLIVLAARPSMGKTALATGILLHCAIHLQRAVALFSLEMSSQQILMRFLAHEALVNLMSLTRGRLEDADYVRLAQAAGHLNTAPIYIDQGRARSVMQIRSRARRLRQEQGDLALIVVDYLQLMDGTGREENRTQEVSSISRGLKLLAMELEVPVLALSQLSRKCEDRADKRPQLADLRESGSIEQDADLVAFLFRPEHYMTAEEAAANNLRGAAELNIAKQRNGPTGKIDLYFRAECARYESMTRRDASEAPEQRTRRNGRHRRDYHEPREV